MSYTLIDNDTGKNIIETLNSQKEEIEQLTISLQAQEELTMNEHLKVERLQARIDKAIKLLKEAGCYDEETKTFCDDIWEELPNILNALEGSDK